MGMNYRDSCAFCLFAALAVGCQTEEGPYLLWEEYQAPNGVERHMGSGCADMYTSMGSTFGVAPGGNVADALPTYSIEYTGDTESVTVRITDQTGQVLDHAYYPEEFLLTGKTDEMRADFANGYVRLKQWGSAVCEVRPPDPEP